MVFSENESISLLTKFGLNKSPSGYLREEQKDVAYFPLSILLEQSRDMGYTKAQKREKVIEMENQSCLRVNYSVRSALWSLWEARCIFPEEITTSST